MVRPVNRKKEKTKALVLNSATQLFIKNGYKNTRIRDIAMESNVGYTEIFRMFNDKDSLLSQLVDILIEYQFEISKKILKDKTDDKLLIYAFECVLQLYITEINNNIREMYAVSYTMPQTSYKIYDNIALKLEEIFKDHLPDYETKDFYELEIAAAGVMRGFIINPCTIDFPIKNKVRRFLNTILKIFEVNEEKIKEVINFIEEFDMKVYAVELINTLYEYISNRIMEE